MRSDMDRRLAAIDAADNLVSQTEALIREDFRRRGIRGYPSAHELHEELNTRWWKRYRAIYGGNGAAALRYVLEASA